MIVNWNFLILTGECKSLWNIFLKSGYIKNLTQSARRNAQSSQKFILWRFFEVAKKSHCIRLNVTRIM